MKAQNIMIILRALMIGQKVKFPDGRIYQLVRDELGKWRFCTQVTSYRFTKANPHKKSVPSPPTKKLMSMEASLEWFLNTCEKFSPEEVIILGANTVLTRRGKERAENREKDMQSQNSGG